MRYLPGLNALRFYAAMSVLIHHIAGYAGNWFEQPRPYTVLHSFILNSDYSVTLFFVLSGYLITCLLLNERQNTGNIAVADFYRRRILRIWPLYYTVLLISGVVALFGGLQAPFQSAIDTSLFVILMANLLTIIAPQMILSLVGHLWTIGVEEQFYLVWPHIVRRIRRPVRTLLLFVILKLSLIFLVYILMYLARTVDLLVFLDRVLSGFTVSSTVAV